MGLEVSLRRQLSHDDIVCPAGQLLGDHCVHCRVEDSVIDGYLNPSSIEAFCAGDNALCPSWRAEVEAREEHRKGVLELREHDAPDPEERARRIEIQKQKSHFLLFSDHPDARAFRRRCKLPEPQAR